MLAALAVIAAFGVAVFSRMGGTYGTLLLMAVFWFATKDNPHSALLGLVALAPVATVYIAVRGLRMRRRAVAANAAARRVGFRPPEEDIWLGDVVLILLVCLGIAAPAVLFAIGAV